MEKDLRLGGVKIADAAQAMYEYRADRYTGSWGPRDILDVALEELPDWEYDGVVASAVGGRSDMPDVVPGTDWNKLEHAYRQGVIDALYGIPRDRRVTPLGELRMAYDRGFDKGLMTMADAEIHWHAYRITR